MGGFLDLDWGDVPGSVGAAVTAASASAAAVGYLHKLWRERREQAAKVVAWADEGNEGGMQHVRRLQVVNSGTENVYGVIATAAEGKHFILHVLPAGRRAMAVLLSESAMTVSKDKDRYVQVWPHKLMPVQFVDARGQAWRRDQGGLRKIGERSADWTGPLSDDSMLELDAEAPIVKGT